MTRCPHCNRRLPRRAEFLPPSYGVRPVTGVIAFTAVWGAGLYTAFHALWPPDLWLWPMPGDAFRLAIGAVLFGAGLALEGVMVTSLFWWLEREQPRRGQEPQRIETAAGAQTVGGDVRRVESRDGRQHWLRERGFHVPAEPERNALVTWAWAIVDGKVTLSQRGARTTIRNNTAVRQWANDVLALFCRAGWASPRNGWNGDEPDLGNGVDEVDEEVVRAVANGGHRALIEMLEELVEESVDDGNNLQV